MCQTPFAVSDVRKLHTKMQSNLLHMSMYILRQPDFVFRGLYPVYFCQSILRSALTQRIKVDACHALYSKPVDARTRPRSGLILFQEALWADAVAVFVSA